MLKIIELHRESEKMFERSKLRVPNEDVKQFSLLVNDIAETLMMSYSKQWLNREATVSWFNLFIQEIRVASLQALSFFHDRLRCVLSDRPSGW